jgi:hypothetical protein
MKYLELFENWSINEDFLELKSIGKQLYSFLKKKGYDVKIKENSQKSKYKGGDTLAGTKDSKYSNGKGGNVEIHQFSDVEEIGVFVPTYALVYMFIMDPNNEETLKELLKSKTKNPDYYLQNKQKDWTNIKNLIFAKSSGQIAYDYDMQANPEIKKYIAKLGQELIGIVKQRYPNMQLLFGDKSHYYAMYFREPKTAKGAVKK